MSHLTNKLHIQQKKLNDEIRELENELSGRQITKENMAQTRAMFNQLDAMRKYSDILLDRVDLYEKDA